MKESNLGVTRSQEKFEEYLDQAAETILGIGTTWAEVSTFYSKSSKTYTDVLDEAFDLLLADEALSEEEKLEKLEELDDALNESNPQSQSYYGYDDVDDYNQSYYGRNVYRGGTYSHGAYTPEPVISETEIKMKLFNLKITTEKIGYTATKCRLRILHKETGENITAEIQDTLRISPAPVGPEGDKYYEVSTINLLRIIGFLNY